MMARNLLGLMTAATMVALALTAKAAEPAQWQTVTGPDGSFTVEMSGTPVYLAEKSESPQGTVYPVHQYVLEHGKATYITQLSLYPKDVDTSDPKAVLQNILDNDVKRMDGGKWTSVEWGNHQGLPAVEALGVSGATEQRSYSVVKGNKLFDLLYYGPLGTANSSDVDRFFSSLKIGG